MNTQEDVEYLQRGQAERRRTSPLMLTINIPYIQTGYGKLLMTAVIAKLLGVNVAEVGALVIKSINPHTFYLVVNTLDRVAKLF